MKRTLIIIAILLSLTLSLMIPALATEVDSHPFFLLLALNDEDGFVMNAFYAETPGGDRYLVSSILADSLADEGYELALVRSGYAEEVEILGSTGDFVFCSADGLEQFEPVKIGTKRSGDEVAFAFLETSDFESYNIDVDSVDLREWTWTGSYYVCKGETINIDYLGGLFMDPETGCAVGMITWDGDDLDLAMVPMTGNCFPNNMAVSHPHTSTAPSAQPETQPAAAPAPAQTTDAEPESRSSNGLLWILAAVAVGAAIFYFSKKRSGKSGQTAPQQPEEYGGTVNLNGPISGQEPSMNDVYSEPQPRPIEWQLRGTEGILRGQIFQLGSTETSIGRGLPNDIAFPADTKGVSGRHCLLCIQNDGVVLRDLNSTYGTYLSGNVRVEPGVNYHLQEGDSITLPGGQCFRLEKAGAMVQDPTPVVRAVDGREYRADLQGRISFGRAARNQVCFGAEDSTISASHCVLYREGSRLYLMDVGSSNGTFFRADQRLRPNQPYEVQKGSCFFLANPKYSFVITED